MLSEALLTDFCFLERKEGIMNPAYPTHYNSKCFVVSNNL